MNPEIETKLQKPQGKSVRRILAILSLLAAFAAVGAMLAGSVGWHIPGLSRAALDPQPETAQNRAQYPWAKLPLPSPSKDVSGKLGQSVDGMRITYTIDPALQQTVENIYAQYKVPYGAFVALDPSTGKVLAFAEYSASEPDTRGLCLRATFPAASLIKVITSAAALKTGKVTPETVVRYEGNPYRLTQRKVSPKNGRNERLSMTLTEALAISNNVVFAKMGINVVGAPGLEAELADFGFNREMPFDFNLQKSTAIVPSDPYMLGRTAAGFGDVYLSPLHAAMIAASVANKGVMMKPYIVERVDDAAGKAIFQGTPAEVGKVIEPELAKTLSEMMTQTVKKGTGTKVFSRYAKKLMTTVAVAGKTGSLSGDDPPGRYEWFIGFAPVDNPRIAVASLVVNKGEMWHIKGTYAAAAVMRELFGL